ncbi:MAG: DUF1292 domain-containing protein [Lachnospiraceae bacterium]|jgi:hypothetical protein|uniref:DUF1292 domain-containing protein n=1 Tax=Clostridium sp. (strain SY8519) TaxID=1042156 RepID=UPI0002171B95|nr:DUF1292 domain-containing protein [Clostridium sp. SY8519]MCI1654568.1 DUF1292 domain-containing protein [Lachnospiraceae bacterium]MCI1656945.1 DUF1292 domain-containing protein [Lachnospiraceae bacterium]MCI2195425.1 DUF1292 domain-containing protein [Lachnospiraceae bacterium]BAK48144.1 predicted signal transduction protein with a C-terminal ATPase domain [Clostridium sp. SY8519]HAD19312.1 DUF1292 domain-containing protein [Lachnospiraceae bacterium]
METISFYDTETNELLEAYVLEQTVIGGVPYLLVTESEDQEEDATAYILREVQGGQAEACYEIVNDDNELQAISKVFAEMLEDVDFEI